MFTFIITFFVVYAEKVNPIAYKFRFTVVIHRFSESSNLKYIFREEILKFCEINVLS